MQVRVLFFGMLTDVVGRRSEIVTLPERSTLGDLLKLYDSQSPGLKEVLPSVAFSVNQEYAAPTTLLRENDEIALLPPVSGGSEAVETERRQKKASIVREKIDVQRIVKLLKHPADGACATFEGIVRDHSRGRRTLYLDYEAYEEMALKQMSDLVEQALAKFQIRDAVIAHRLGRLVIGETSVLIAVASGHRAAAFDACRWLIDTLKRTVPIWKKEYFEDGAVWADGEPFPVEK